MILQKKKLTHTTKYVLIACCFMLTVNVILGIVLSMQSRKSMTVLIRERMLDAANTAAAALDGDLVGAITAADVTAKSTRYLTVYNTLNLFQNHMNMKYIYVVKSLDEKSFVFVVDPDPVDPGKFGEPVVYTDALYNASQGKAGVDKTPFSDRWGNFYSAYCPVYNSEGKIAGIVGVDYDANWFEEQIALNTASILIICAFSLIVGSGIIVLITNRFRKKVRTLSAELSELSHEVDSLTKEMSANVDLQRTSSAAPPDLINDPGDGNLANTFDALSDKIHRAHQDVKQYVSFVREQDYTDALTGVGNKTAYLETIRDLDLEILDGKAEFSIALFDVNNLRTINHKYGLKVGDQLIYDTATLLLKVFDSKNIYRIGSDEFVVLHFSSSEEEVTNAIHSLEAALEAYNTVNKTNKVILSFTSGSATFVPERDHQFSDVLARAFEALSQHKALYYQQAEDRRRR